MALARDAGECRRPSRGRRPLCRGHARLGACRGRVPRGARARRQQRLCAVALRDAAGRPRADRGSGRADHRGPAIGAALDDRQGLSRDEPALFGARRRSAGAFQQLRGVDASLESALVGQCRIFVVVGKFEEALTTCRQLLARSNGRDAFAQAQIAAALGRLGRHAESGKQLAQMRAQYDAASEAERPNVAFFLATAYAGLEQPDQVFLWLEVAARGKSSRLAYLRVDPRFARRAGRSALVTNPVRLRRDVLSTACGRPHPSPLSMAAECGSKEIDPWPRSRRYRCVLSSMRSRSC